MKNISYVINGVLAVAIIVLFILFFTSNKNGGGEATSLKFVEGDSSVVLPVAYVDMDSLVNNYNFAKDVNEKFMKKLEDNRLAINKEQKSVEAQAADFQKKIDNNAYLTQQRAQEEAERIQKLGVNLQQKAQRMEMELAQEEQRINKQMTDSISLCLKEFNKTANYQIIFSNRGLDNILVAKDVYNITQDVLNLLNSRYKPESK